MYQSIRLMVSNLELFIIIIVRFFILFIFDICTIVLNDVVADVTIAVSGYGQYAHYHDADKASNKYAANKAAYHFNHSFQFVILARRLPRTETFPFSHR